MTRSNDLERVYQELGTFARRSRELSFDLHPGLSLVAFTFLSFVQDHPGTRAADVVTAWGLDKSTVSRQLSALLAADLLARSDEQPGRRGRELHLTATGERALDSAAHSVKALMMTKLESWHDNEITDFAHALQRFNDS